VHPEDLHGWVDAVHAGLHQRRLVVHEHRLVDREGLTRFVLLVARGLPGPDGLPCRVDGVVLSLDEDALPSASEDGLDPVLPTMTALGLSAVAARALLSVCGPPPVAGTSQRLQVVGADGVGTPDGGDPWADVSAALFPDEPGLPAAG
jgi:hypothetical protein